MPEERVEEPASDHRPSPLQGRMLFLVGARRSGTNWLERVLTAHPEMVAMPSETYLFSHGIRPLTEVLQHSNPGSPMMAKAFVSRPAMRQGLRELTDRVFVENLERLDPDATYLLERTPSHALHLDLIAETYPDARVIHLIRDGRAVARSLTSLERGALTIADGAAEWRDHVSCREDGRRLFGARYTEVRYEALLGDPVGGMRDLFAWLELEHPAGLLDAVATEARAEFNIDPGSPGVGTDKWRDELSKSDLAAIERIAGPELAELGYTDASQRPGTDPPPSSASARRGSRLRGRNPVAVRRRRAQRRRAREVRWELIDNLAAVERFFELIDRGDLDPALSMCEPLTQVHIDTSGFVEEGRGPGATRRAFEALATHGSDSSEREVVSSKTHSSPRAFTVVREYRLAGVHWTQTSVIHIVQGVIRSLYVRRDEVVRSAAQR